MSKTDLSFKNNIKITKKEENDNLNEKHIFIKTNILKNKEIENSDNNNINNIQNTVENNNDLNDKNNNNNSFDESNPNYSISREFLNYYLSFFYEQDFSLEEKDEPKNAGFFARLFGNYPKIYPLMQELKSERDFLIFLKRTALKIDNDISEKIFKKILNFMESNIVDIEEDKILKKNNLSNLINKSNILLKEKMKSFLEMQKMKKKKKIIFEEYNTESIPILMMLQLLTIIEKYPNFVELFAIKCFPNEKEIILAFSFYLSDIAYDRLLSGRLNIFFNRNKLVLDNYEEFYLGLFEYAYDLFESNKYIDQEKFSRLQSEAENMPSSILWKTKNFKLKYPTVQSENSLSKFFNSSSVNQK